MGELRIPRTKIGVTTNPASVVRPLGRMTVSEDKLLQGEVDVRFHNGVAPGGLPLATGAVEAKVTTLTALRARTSTGVADNYVILVQGGDTFGDGQGGLYSFSTTSAAADDNLTVIRPNDRSTGNAGRWLAVLGSGGGAAVEATDEGIWSPGATEDEGIWTP